MCPYPTLMTIKPRLRHCVLVTLSQFFSAETLLWHKINRILWQIFHPVKAIECYSMLRATFPFTLLSHHDASKSSTKHWRNLYCKTVFIKLYSSNYICVLGKMHLIKWDGSTSHADCKQISWWRHKWIIWCGSYKQYKAQEMLLNMRILMWYLILNPSCVVRSVIGNWLCCIKMSCNIQSVSLVGVPSQIHMKTSNLTLYILTYLASALNNTQGHGIMTTIIIIFYI